jgi:hypothetical protein
MCLECEPENDHGCCRLRMTLAPEYAQGTVPKIYARRIGARHYDTLYAVWMERNGVRIADCIEACCATCAKADFIGQHFIADKAEAELNRIYALDDPRPAVPTGTRMTSPSKWPAS